MALLKGLRLAWEGRYPKLEVNMDSQIAVSLIQGPCTNNQALHFIIKECQDLLFNRAWEISFNHCYRETNRVADHMANIQVGQSPLLLFSTPLPFQLALFYLKMYLGSFQNLLQHFNTSIFFFSPCLIIIRFRMRIFHSRAYRLDL